MKLFNLFCAALLCGALLNCAASEKNNSTKSSSQTAEKDSVEAKVPPAEPIDYGTILMTVKVLELSASDRTLNVELVEVIGYGASTKPVSTGRQMTMTASESIDMAKLATGSTVDIQVQQQTAMMGSDSKSTWVILKLMSTS